MHSQICFYNKIYINPYMKNNSLDKLYFNDQFDDNGYDLGQLAECFESNGRIGVKVDGNEIIPAIYDKIRLVKYEGMFSSYFIALVGIKDEVDQSIKWGILSNENTKIEDPIFDKVWFHVKDSTIRLKKDEKYYVLNIENNVPRFEIDNYSYVGDFISFSIFNHIPEINKYLLDNNIEDRKYAIMKKDDKYGIILDNGTVLVKPLLFKKIENFTIIREYGVLQLRAMARTGGGYRVDIDYRGYFFGIIPPDYYDILKVTENRFIAQNSNKMWGIIDNCNNVICDFDYLDYFPNNNPLFSWKPNKESEIFVCDKGKVLVNINNGERISEFYDSIFWYENNSFCRVGKDGKYGIATASGEVVIPCIYERIYGLYHNDNGYQANDVIFDGVHGKIVNNDFKKDPIPNHSSVEDTHRNNTYEPISPEPPTYVRYAGSYAQDEMGYSDDDIDTVLDGNPDAYWNID